MPKLHFSRAVSFSPQQMLALIGDLESYPQFVPNCSSMAVKTLANGKQHALMSIEFGPVSQSYTSEVLSNADKMTLTARAIDGPFSHLDSKWSFAENGQGARVDFDIDFKIANPLLAAVAEPAFAAKQEQIIDAFIDEAKRRYS